LELWRELQAYYESQEECKQSPGGHCGPLLNLCGGIMLGKPGSEVIEGTLKSIREHQLPHQYLSSEEVKARFPAFQLQPDEVGIYEDNAGYLHPELCIESYVHMAKAHGAEAHYGEKLLSYEDENEVIVEGEGEGEGDEKGGSGARTAVVRVKTDQGQYRCRKLVLTVGAWAPEIYGGDIPLKLHIERRVLFWFKPNIAEDQQEYYSVRNSEPQKGICM
jgi:sarcosine oxidase